MFSLERLLISFSALIGDSVSKTPKMHVLLCLLTFGLLAIGMLLVEIEDDVFKLWVRILYFLYFCFCRRYFLSLLGENVVSSVFCSCSLRDSSRDIEGKKEKKKDEPRGGREKRERCWILCFSLSLFSSLFFKIQFFFCSIQFCLFSFPRFFLTDSLFASLLFLKFVKIRAAAG